MSTGSPLDQYTTLQDKVRLELNEYGAQYVPIKPADLAAKLGVPSYNIYQTLYRLQSRNEITLDKQDSKIIGVTIHKLEPSGRTYHRAAERAKAETAKVVLTTENIGAQMTALQEYLHQKLAILDMQETAKKAGLNPEDIIKFEPNPYAEEGLLLLKLLDDVSEKLAETKKKLQMTEFDLEAERRNVKYLTREKRDSTRRDLLASASN